MATQTTNYHFPKYEADDLPNLLDEYNEFADLADAAINNAMMTATNAGTAAQNAKTAADAASAKVDDVEDAVGTLSVQVTAAKNTAEQSLSLAQTNESDIAGLDSQMETANQSIAQLQTGKAPTSHASTSTQYGAATLSNFGHVKLTDTPSNTSASSSTALTPIALQNVLDQCAPVTVASGSFPTSAGIATIQPGDNSVQVFAIPLIKLLVISIHVDKIATISGGQAIFILEGFIPEQYRPTNQIRMQGTSYALPNGDTYISFVTVLPNGNLEATITCAKAISDVGMISNMMMVYGSPVPVIED